MEVQLHHPTPHAISAQRLSRWQSLTPSFDKRLFAYSPDLKRAYTYREQLRAIFDEELSKEEAKHKIKNWRRRVKASGLQCYQSFFKTLDKWLGNVINLL